MLVVVQLSCPVSQGMLTESWRCRDACTGLKLECFNVLRPTPLLSMKSLKPWKGKGKAKTEVVS